MSRSTKSAKATVPDLQVVNRAIADLRSDPRNPRKHPRRQVKQIANSIEAFGFSVPVLVDAQLQIIAGHGRLAACQQLGWTQIPTICLAHLTPEQARALLLADNRLTDISTWDDQLLAETLLELSNVELTFSLEDTGFDMGEIDWRIAGLADEPEVEDAADQVPNQGSIAVSQIGDVWVLGEHRVLCGDALEPANLTALVGDERMRMVFTDPPYNVPIQGHVSGLGALQHREFVMGSGEMTQSQFADFLERALHSAAGTLVDGGICFTCMDWGHVDALIGAVGKSGGELKNICVWVKHNAGMGSLYRSAHELVVVSKHGRAPHVNNVQLGRHGRHRTNVWRYPGANSPGARRGKEGDLLALHPTPKPVALVADAILDCSHRNDAVLDLFLGSGTTLIAAQRTGRRCFGAELDPVYVDTVIRRFEAFTGFKAIHLSTGQSFSDREKASGFHEGVVA